MLKKILFLLVVVQLTACTELQNIAGTMLEEGVLSNEQIGSGLKEALDIGISKGADELSTKDGYFKSAYKILLPEEVQKVTNKLKNVPGFTQVEDRMLELLNRAAEDAAKSAKPIFVGAIKQMSFSDATEILMGADNAATSYLNRTTNQQLYKEFQPKIVRSLDKVNATKYWKDAVTAYNNIPFVQKLNPSLDDYVTTEALKGLFGMVEKKEKGIRMNISERTSDLLKKVFAKQDNK
jgi:predicted thioredoxin/glutaredoxin